MIEGAESLSDVNNKEICLRVYQDRSVDPDRYSSNKRRKKKNLLKFVLLEIGMLHYS